MPKEEEKKSNIFNIYLTRLNASSMICALLMTDRAWKNDDHNINVWELDVRPSPGTWISQGPHSTELD